jgi:hypothetical protein
MKIVNHAEFLSLPTGTVFSKFSPMVLDELCIKGETIGAGDFAYESLSSPVSYGQLESMMEGNITFAPFGQMQRDGCFDNGQLYLVWDVVDVVDLIKQLQGTL